MKKEHSALFRRIYSILLSVSLAVAGICLIVGCVAIYSSGERAFTREIVGETFAKIAIPVYVCLAMTVIGFVIELFIPAAENEKKFIPYAFLLKRMAGKKSLDGCDSETLALISRERKSRRLHVGILIALLCISGVVFSVYALNPANYHQSEINSSMINAMKWLFPCLAIPFGYAVFVAYRNEKSIKRELALLKPLPNAENACAATASSNRKILVAVKTVLLAAGIAAIIYGIYAGGVGDVLTKAINICTECIGLG